MHAFRVDFEASTSSNKKKKNIITEKKNNNFFIGNNASRDFDVRRDYVHRYDIPRKIMKMLILYNHIIITYILYIYVIWAYMNIGIRLFFV